MELQVGVKLVIKNKSRKILLLKRGEKYGIITGQWDIVGGRIKTGVRLSENLKREVKEEIGIDWKEKFKLIAAVDILDSNEKHVVRLTYLSKTDKPLKIKLDEEHTDYKWFNLNTLRKMKAGKINKYFKMLLDSGVVK